MSATIGFILLAVLAFAGAAVCFRAACKTERNFGWWMTATIACSLAILVNVAVAAAIPESHWRDHCEKDLHGHVLNTGRGGSDLCIDDSGRIIDHY